jgi:hypothetical protein
MRHTPYLFVLAIAFLLASCQREVMDALPSDNVIDSLEETSASRPRQITVKHPSATDPMDFVFSLEFDTAAHAIDIFLDNPATSTPYDTRVITYVFNGAGYLVKSEAVKIDEDGNILNSGRLHPDYVLVRNAANQIEKWIDYDSEYINDSTSANDTGYYRYGPGFIENWRNPSSKQVARFDAKNRLQTLEYYHSNALYNTRRYSYDAVGNISRILSDKDTTEFTYAAPVDSGWNALSVLFLGKDASVLMHEPFGSRLGFNFLSYIIESRFETIYNPLLTQPLAGIQVRGKPLYGSEEHATQTIAFRNTYTPDGKISTITATPGDDASFYYTFTY